MNLKDSNFEAFEIIGDLCTLLVERKIGNYSKVEEYHLKVKYDGETVYNNRLSVMQWVIYERFIRERLVVLLQDCGKLHKDYVMIEIGNRMYRILDECDPVDTHRYLKRVVKPCDYTVEEAFTMDLVMDCTMYDGFAHPEGELVFKFDSFYINGNKLDETLNSLEKFCISSSDLEFDCPKIIRDYFENTHDIKINSYVGPSCHAYYG